MSRFVQSSNTIKSMLVHHYDSNSHFYLSSSEEGYESPLEPGVFIIPGNATTIAPPTSRPEGIKYCFNEQTQTWEELVVPDAVHMSKLRQNRNTVLQQTDHLMLPDYPLKKKTKEQWAEYRQKLRDLPHTTLNLSNIQWPLPPTTELSRVTL
jgi:Phage tail assembly chaperone protein